MATKMANIHINKIIEESQKYNTPVVYVILAHLSVEVKAKKQELIDHLNNENKEKKASRHFFIQTIIDHKRINKEKIQSKELFYEKQALVNILSDYIDADRRTLYSAINELMSLSILNYNKDYLAWELINMEDMFVSKNSEIDDNIDVKGYTEIRDLLLSDTFKKAQPYQRKLWLYLCQLKSSISGKNFRKYHKTDFEFNLLNKKNWTKVFNTNSVYFARYRILKFFQQNKQEIQNLGFEESGFKISFDIPNLRVPTNEDQLLEVQNASDLSLIRRIIDERNDFYHETQHKTMNISNDKIYKIARVIRNIKNENVKELIVTKIINKYAAMQIYNSTREPIKSLLAYAYATARTTINEYTEQLKRYLENNKKQSLVY